MGHSKKTFATNLLVYVFDAMLGHYRWDNIDPELGRHYKAMRERLMEISNNGTKKTKPNEAGK